QKGRPARPQQARRRSVLWSYVEPLSAARTPLADFLNILLRKKQVQEEIVFRRQVQGRSVTNEAGDDPAMLFCEARCIKGQLELLPPQTRIGHDFGLVFDWESMYHGR